MASVKFDSIRIAEIAVNFLDSTPSVTAKAAFVDTKTGATHGWTTGKRWSDETMQKLRELKESMERDLVAQHFDDGSAVTPTTTSSGGLRESFQGLGEHLGGASDTTPQG